MAETAKKQQCKIEGCKGEYRAKGYCTRHYRKWRQGKYGKGRYKICGQEDCQKPLSKKGLCVEHYQTWSEARKAKMPQAPGTPPAEAEAKADAVKKPPLEEVKPA